ncbi:MAG: hypothetical protein K0R66_422 [Gammaproteobacteria bacterium]|jgi:hypothetical protein|nr:hypothetical protein [Gammaproteobacteria bacterium]
MRGWEADALNGPAKSSLLGVPLMPSGESLEDDLGASLVAEEVVGGCGSRSIARIRRVASSVRSCLNTECLQNFSIAAIGIANVAASYRNFAGSFGFFRDYLGLDTAGAYSLAALAVVPSIGTLWNTTPELVKEKVPGLYRKLTNRPRDQACSETPDIEAVLKNTGASKLSVREPASISANPYLSLGFTAVAFTFSTLASTVLAQMSNTAFANTHGPDIANPSTRADVQNFFYAMTIVANILGYGVKILQMGDVAGQIIDGFRPSKMQQHGKRMGLAYAGKAAISAGIIVCSGFGVYSNVVNGEDSASTIGASRPGQLSYGMISSIPFFALNVVELFKLFGLAGNKKNQNSAPCSNFCKFLHILLSISLAGLGAASTIYFTFQAEQEKIGNNADPALSWTLIGTSGACALLSRYNITSEFIENGIGKLALCFSRKQTQAVSPSSVSTAAADSRDAIGRGLELIANQMDLPGLR